MMRVFKFGGALLSTAKNINHMAGIVDEFSCQPLVVVVSAIGKTTNKLENLLQMSMDNDDSLPLEYFKLKSFHINLIRDLELNKEDELIADVEEIFRNLWDVLNENHENYYRAYDRVVSFGEIISSKIVSYKLKEKKHPFETIDARELIITDDNFTEAALNWEKTEAAIKSKVIPVLENHKFVLTQGFIGSSEGGDMTTLGREGSDFTAAVFANIIDASEIIIWKDVPGLMNADPHLFKDAKKLDNISYREAVELAFYGAKVIHPKTIQPLQQKGIPLQIRSFFMPFEKPSIISSDTSGDEKIHKIIVKQNQVLLSISSKNLDFIAEKHLHKIFRSLTKNKIHVNIMQNSAVSFSVSFNYNKMKLESVVSELEDEFYLRYNTGLELITLRHYSDDLINRIVGNKKVYLEQKSRTTIQLLVK